MQPGKRHSCITSYLSDSTRGAAYDEFPESGWDKIYALNVKAMFYTTVGLLAKADLVLSGR